MTKHLADPVGYLERNLSAVDMAAAKRHLADCSACADRVRRLERTVGHLTAAACDARIACPDGGQIAGYVFGGLSAADLQRVRRHESRCDACRREIDLLRRAAQADPAPARAKVLPADLADAAARMNKERLAERLMKAVAISIGKNAARLGDFVGRVEELLSPQLPVGAAASKRHLSGEAVKPAPRKKTRPKAVQPDRKKVAAVKPKAKPQAKAKPKAKPKATPARKAGNRGKS